MPRPVLPSVASMLFGTALTLFAATLPTPAAAQQAASPAKPIPVNIGLPITNYWPAYVARERKFFEAVGLEPKFFSFQTGAPLIAGMKNGSLDVAWTGLATLFMLGQNIPLKFVLVPLDSSSQMAMVVHPESGITGWRDIAKSKNVGVPTATCAEVSMVLAAKAAGVPRSAINSSNLAPNLLQTALSSKQIDTTFIWGPWHLALRDAGYKIVSYDKDFQIGGGVCATTVAIRPAFLEANPSVGCRLIKAHALSLAAGRSDPASAARTLQEALNVSPAVAKEVYETLLIPSIESQVEARSPWSLTDPDGGLAEKLYVAGQALYEAKAFDKPITRQQIQQSVDGSHIKRFLETDCR
ncbi:MAG TPA: ABC transporter substrate-binding protein [Burkholderiaceae bacterium]|nr:ABC transporter substrate-binding protein [Burkholderiaceae bacterium]